MKNYRAYLMGGVCLGLVSAQVSGIGPWNMAAAQAEDAAAGPSGSTTYYGDMATPASPAWAADAAMNPDYTAEAAAEVVAADETVAEEPAAVEPETAEPAAEEPAAAEPQTAEPATEEPAAEEPQTADPATEEPAAEEPQTADPATEEPAAEEPAATVAEELPMTPPGVTSYYGDTAPAETPAWSAEAAMNPDYSPETAAAPGEPAAEAPAAEAPAAEPAAAEEPAAEEPAATVAEELPMTPPGVTSYYGDTAPAETPAWAAEAAMNPDYSPEAAAPAAGSPAAEEPGAAEEPAAAEAPAAEEPAAAEQPAAEEPAAEAPAAEEPAAAEQPAAEEPAAAAPAAEPAAAEEPKEDEGFWNWLKRKIFG